MKYRKKPVVIEATQWHESGDHPEDNRETFTGSDGKTFCGEGKVVRYYRTPAMDGETTCDLCGDIMHSHGWIDVPLDGHTVCPGDWIITDVHLGYYPIKPDIFQLTYDAV